MMLESLELIERAEMWILVTQVDNQANGNLVVFQMVNIGATQCPAGKVAKRPAYGMDDLTGHMNLGVDVPDFLKANAVVLRRRVFI